MDTGTQFPPLGGLIWPILWAIVSYSRRKEEIGGWLFFYYGQLYLGSVLTVLLLLANFQPADPLYLFTIVPLSAIIIAQAVVAHRLRRTRDPAYLIPLRRILWAHLLFAIIKIAIDSKYSPIATILDGIGVIWPALWLPYFYRSVRVGHVFVTKDWMRVAEFVTD